MVRFAIMTLMILSCCISCGSNKKVVEQSTADYKYSITAFDSSAFSALKLQNTEHIIPKPTLDYRVEMSADSLTIMSGDTIKIYKSHSLSIGHYLNPEKKDITWYKYDVFGNILSIKQYSMGKLSLEKVNRNGIMKTKYVSLEVHPD